MKKITIILLGVMMFGIASCNNFKKGEGDMLYEILIDKKGAAIKDGEVIELTATEKTEEGSEIWNSRLYDRTAVFKKSKSVFKGDLFAALGMLSEGDSAIVKINLDSMVTKMGRVRPEDTKGRYLIYTLKINRVIHREELNDSLYNIRINRFLKTRLTQLRDEEGGKVKNYINNKNLKPDHTNSGLQYIITKKGTGTRPTPGDTVAVEYTGMLMSGKIFATTYSDVATKANIKASKGEFSKIILGLNRNVPGLEEALKLFPTGTKATIIIPSKLAYGENGNYDDYNNENIQPYSPLIYVFEVGNITHPKEKLKILTGTSMPDFILYRLNNSVFTKNNIRKGNKSMFVFFDITCDHCQREIEAINNNYNKLGAINIYLTSLNAKPDVTKFINTYAKLLNNKNNVTVLLDKNFQLQLKFQSVKYPSLYMYSKRNELLKYYGGPADIMDIIKIVNQE
jgi:FKBP-type peptidyl-prolyl cis-trans isomerase FkpA